MEAGTAFNWCVKAFNGKKPTIHDATLFLSDRNRNSIKIPSYLNIVNNLWSESIKRQEKLKQNVNTLKRSSTQ